MKRGLAWILAAWIGWVLPLMAGERGAIMPPDNHSLTLDNREWRTLDDMNNAADPLEESSRAFFNLNGNLRDTFGGQKLQPPRPQGGGRPTAGGEPGNKRAPGSPLQPWPWE
ncbi:MAG: hypothetical protein HQL58_09945 [Magnetococcales bacterium]|nr:hypothetical protein [Magnetococcales bacterium]